MDEIKLAEKLIEYVELLIMWKNAWACEKYDKY